MEQTTLSEFDKIYEIVRALLALPEAERQFILGFAAGVIQTQDKGKTA